MSHGALLSDGNFFEVPFRRAYVEPKSSMRTDIDEMAIKGGVYVHTRK